MISAPDDERNEHMNDDGDGDGLHFTLNNAITPVVEGIAGVVGVVSDEA